jgi:ketosteroid isomerase-like protein
VPATHQQIYERYVWAGLTRDSDAQAELFTEDATFEAPFAPEGGVFPRRVEGRDGLRTFFKELHERTAKLDQKVDPNASRYVLHTTADPEVFIAEIDAAVEIDGSATTMSLVQIFRLRDGRIAMMRDYFAPEHAY